MCSGAISCPAAHTIYVQRQLGHSSITITERYYGHLEQSFADAAASETERAIWGAAA